MIPYRASLRSDLASRGLSEPPDSLPRNRWTICPGPAGRFGSEQVDELDRNEWTLSSGPGGRFHRNTHIYRQAAVLDGLSLPKRVHSASRCHGNTAGRGQQRWHGCRHRDWAVALIGAVIWWCGSTVSSHSCGIVCGSSLLNSDRATAMGCCESLGQGVMGLAGPVIGAVLVTWFGGVSTQGIRPLFLIASVLSLVSLLLISTQLS